MQNDIDTYITELETQLEALHDEVETLQRTIGDQEKVYEINKKEAKEKAHAMLEDYDGEGLGVVHKGAQNSLPKVKNEDILKVISQIVE